MWYGISQIYSSQLFYCQLQADLSRCIEDFLNITAQCAPSILILKPKFHFLVHLPAFIRRFGPAIIFSTERYESFNRVFRLSSIYSNRQLPSRDTCTTFASHDIVKHIATGGFWFDATFKKWVCAGTDVRGYIQRNPTTAHLLGVPSNKAHDPGTPGNNPSTAHLIIIIRNGETPKQKKHT